jgi:pimeloyl-ACP methyl ester carboxylesterase
MACLKSRRAYAQLSYGQMHFREAGNPGAPVLLLLHQSPSSSAMYERLMERLADRFYLLAPDTPGFGLSDPLPVAMPSIEGYASAINELLKALDITHLGVFGHHTGAAIAVQLAFDKPGKIAAMALSGPTLLSDEQRELLPTLAQPVTPQADGSHLLQLWQRFRDKDPQAPLALLEREMYSALTCGDSYLASYQAVCAHDFAGQLQTIRCPALVFAGDKDPLYNSVAPSLALLSNSETAQLPGGERTYVCERQVEIIAGLLGDFFAKGELHGS